MEQGEPIQRNGVIPWEQLRGVAVEVARMAYAPYSQLCVGAAAWSDDGRIVRGCNVENASFGLTLCAECGLIADLTASGGGRLVAVSIVAGDGAPLAPCGRCRQLLFEHGGPELLIDAGRESEPMTMGDLLPGAFTGEDLRTRRAGS